MANRSGVIHIQTQPSNPRTQIKPKPPKKREKKERKKKEETETEKDIELHSCVFHGSALLKSAFLCFPMDTILSSRTLSPLLNHRSSSPTKILLPPSLQLGSNSLFLAKPITSSLKRHSSQPLKPSLLASTSWFSFAQHGLAAVALSLALNFCPVLPSGSALASEFDVLNVGPPKDSYVVDDAGVLSRVTKTDLRNLLSDLESRKKFHINFITVRKLTVKFFHIMISLVNMNVNSWSLY